MEETKNKNGDLSTDSSSATIDGIRPRVNPQHINNGLNAFHQEAPNNKHGYWRGREVWGRSSESPDSLNKITDSSRAMIDTKVPFESVKDAVNLFGGNVEWKALKALAKERSKNFEQELEKVEQEVPLYQKQLEATEGAKASVLQELEITKKQVEELRLQIQKAQTEETQAQQDSELAQLRVKEIEEGIGKEHSLAAKAQVKVVRTRLLEADDEMKSIKVEVDALKKECDQLIKERDVATKKAEGAVMASEDLEERVEELTIELIVVKEALESARALHLKTEELQLNAAMEREQGIHNWEQELKQSKEELDSCEEKLTIVNNLKLKFDTASALLSSLNLELAAYMETELVREEKQEFAQPDALTLTAARKELGEVKISIKKAENEVNCLSIAASSLKSELEGETSRLSLLKQKEKMSDLTVSSLEVKLEKNQSEQEEFQVKENKFHEEMREFPGALQEKTEEIDEAKSKSFFARQELSKAMEEAELAKASASTMELRLQAVFKEIEAAKASEKLALESIKAIQESEEATESSQEVISIPLEEYYALSKRASEAERLSNQRMVVAVEQIKDAKRTESISRQKLEAAYKEIKERKEALRDAIRKSEKATEGKLKMEQELRNWRAENEQRRKASEAVRCYWKSFDEGRDTTDGSNPASLTLRVNSTPCANRHYSVTELRPRRKKSLFPRIVMFLARKKVQSLK